MANKRIEIINILVLSTEHITPEVSTTLSSLINDIDGIHMRTILPRFVEHAHGYIFFLGAGAPSLRDLADIEMESLHPVFEFALGNKCYYIDFDQDADIIPELPQYDW
jgi:hypothetical protein